MAVPTILVFGVLAVLIYREHKRQIQGPDDYQPPSEVMTIWNVSDSTASTVSWWCFKSSHQLCVEKQPDSVNMLNGLYSPLQGPYMSHGTLLQLPYSPRVAKNVISTPASLPDTTHQGPLFGLALLGHGDPEGEFCGHMWAHMFALKWDASDTGIVGGLCAHSGVYGLKRGVSNGNSCCADTVTKC